MVLKLFSTKFHEIWLCSFCMILPKKNNKLPSLYSNVMPTLFLGGNLAFD